MVLADDDEGIIKAHLDNGISQHFLFIILRLYFYHFYLLQFLIHLLWLSAALDALQLVLEVCLYLKLVEGSIVGVIVLVALEVLLVFG